MSESLIRSFLGKNERFARKTNERIPSPGTNVVTYRQGATCEKCDVLPLRGWRCFSLSKVREGLHEPAPGGSQLRKFRGIAWSFVGGFKFTPEWVTWFTYVRTYSAWLRPENRLVEKVSSNFIMANGKKRKKYKACGQRRKKWGTKKSRPSSKKNLEQLKVPFLVEKEFERLNSKHSASGKRIMRD